MARNIYRKWSDLNQQSEHFLMIRPDGTMKEICFTDEGYLGEKVSVYETGALNPLNPDVFKKHKEVCSKIEWDRAKKKAHKYIEDKIK